MVARAQQAPTVGMITPTFRAMADATTTKHATSVTPSTTCPALHARRQQPKQWVSYSACTWHLDLLEPSTLRSPLNAQQWQGPRRMANITSPTVVTNTTDHPLAGVVKRPPRDSAKSHQPNEKACDEWGSHCTRQEHALRAYSVSTSPLRTGTLLA